MSDTIGTAKSMPLEEAPVQATPVPSEGAAPVAVEASPVVSPVAGAPAAPEPSRDAGEDILVTLSQDRINVLLSNWLREYIYGSAVSRNTEAYNHLVGVLPDLRNILIKG